MERLRLTETQAKKLADKQSRKSRSRGGGSNKKWAVIGIVFGLVLVVLLFKGGGKMSSMNANVDNNASEEEENEDIISEPISTTASPTFSPVKETHPPAPPLNPNINEEVVTSTSTMPPEKETTVSTEPPETTTTPPTTNSEEVTSTTTTTTTSPAPLIITHENIDGSSNWGLNQQQKQNEEDEPEAEEGPEVSAASESVPSFAPSFSPSNSPSGAPVSTSSGAPSAAPTVEEITGGHWMMGGEDNNSDNNLDDPQKEEEPTTTKTSSSDTNAIDTIDADDGSPAPVVDEKVTDEQQQQQQLSEEQEEEMRKCMKHPPVKIIQFCKGTIDEVCLQNECQDYLNIDLNVSVVATPSPQSLQHPEEIMMTDNTTTTESKDDPKGDDNEDDDGSSITNTTTTTSNDAEEDETNDDNNSAEVDSDDKEDTSPEGNENVNNEDDEEKEEEVLEPQTTTTMPYQYQRRGRSISTGEAQQLAEKWGQWTLVDSKADQRPDQDYCGSYPNRDIPWNDFPPNAWQTDSKYVTEFLKEGKALVMRAMEVHLAEYGFGVDDLPGEDFETRRDKSPFLLELKQEGEDDDEERRLSTGVNDRAGWAPQKSFDGLVRRLLHAVVSGSDFNLVLGGHSAAAGHGNYFQQSYSMQFQRVIEPVLARLGVKHYSRNTGMGGLGTIQSAMGARDIYGSDVDVLIWDSAMTEPTKSPDFDLFIRQGILGSDRAPLLWAGNDDPHLLPILQEHADIDFMMYGTGLGPLPSITEPTKIDEIPWAARYMKCDNDFHSLCEDNKYNGTCWIERPDHFDPPTPQNDELGGKASWHDGNRVHQLYGRTMSFTVLSALYEALEFWDEQPQHKLSDDTWHMTDYYENIQSKLANLDPEIGLCYDVAEKNMSTAFCTTTFQSKTEFTPRANPEETSIRSIMKPFGPDGALPQPEENIYEPPDVYNEILGVPEGEVDYLAIIENGLDYTAFDAPKPLPRPTKTGNRLIELTVDDNGEKIVPGLGWGINTKSSPNLCNGTYDSFCGRSADHKCLLYAHNDYRGGLTFDSLSGWGIFTLRNVEKGMIFLKMDSWRKAKDNPVTEGWTEVNNGTQGVRSLKSPVEANEDMQRNVRRRMKKDANAEFCKDFLLEFAFGDQVVRMNHNEILGERHALVQRVVQIWTVLDDPDFTDGEEVDIELGIRLRGCQRQHVFWLSTIYWA